MKSKYIDLHCHPSLKPFGKSFQRKNTTGQNSSDHKASNSIWKVQRPTRFRKALNVFLRLTKWRQSDFSTLSEGHVNVIVTSLYPLEKGMVVHPDGADVKYSGRLFRNLATGISMRRVRHLQKMADYFEDLMAEYNYYRQLHGQTVKINGKNKTYKLVSEASQIDFDALNTIYVILSIEGAHVFNCGLQLAGRVEADETEVLQLVNEVKYWQYKPFFIGLAHHFDNELCGFAKSFTGLVATQLKQNANPKQGLTELGKKVIHRLLNNTNGNRILIDLKHMNAKSRYEFYTFIKEHYQNEAVPLIVSHGALNGKLHPVTHNHAIQKGFHATDINFFFDEIQRIEASKGIFGIQLDERRIFDQKTKELIYAEAKTNMTPFGKPRLRKNAYFIWRQIEHIARYLDTLDRNAWNIQSLGTDFDGIIDPLSGWWTAKELQFLGDYLENHARDFLKSPHGKALKPKNKLPPSSIISKFMTDNAKEFITTHFN